MSFTEVSPEVTRLVTARRERLTASIRERLAAAFRDRPKLHTATVTLSRYPGLSARSTMLRDYATTPAASAPVPKTMFNPADDLTPTYGARRSFRTYREDFVADGSFFDTVHDTVNQGASRLDSYGAALLAKAGSDPSAEPAHTADLLRILLEADAVNPHANGAVRQAPVLNNRDLIQRTSKRQRKLLRVFKLVLTGLPWTDAAEAAGYTRESGATLRDEVESLVGRSYRAKTIARGANGRFVGRGAKRRSAVSR
jgi:hypothetical protein